MDEEELYYKGVMKECTNCFYKRWSIGSSCKLYPNWMTNTALNTCKFKQWQPNQKMYDMKDLNNV